ncbi:MAG: DMT family transporter [Hyphomicrobiales bacterium]|nr:DMT family transporter [Hyphomicrobiales bacterium]
MGLSFPRRAANAVPRVSIDAVDEKESAARRRGIFLMCCALVCFACLDTTGKWLGRHVPVWEVVWSRYVGATVLMLIFTNPWRITGSLKTQRPLLQSTRALLLFGSTALNFLALRTLQLADTMSIAFALPLVVSLLAGPILGEWVGPRRLIAICVGFVGVLVVVQPGHALQPGMLFSISSLFCYAFYNMFTRMISASDPATTTNFFSAISGWVILTPFLPFFWIWPDHAGVWLGLAATGVFGGFGHYLLILAHGRAPAAVLAPYVYTQIVWMTALGFIVFGDVPGLHTAVGAGIVVASGLYLFYRERVRARDA